GDIKISESTVTEAEIDNQSGDLTVTGIKGDKLTVKSSLGDIKIDDSKFDLIKVELSAGDLKLSAIDADINLSLSMGDIKISDYKMSGKIDSDIKVSFGDVEIGLREPALYDYYKSVGDEKAEYKAGMEIEDDLRICEKNKKCLRIDNTMGTITVK
ncbi:MAG: DUF4097 domain-containing protein, partial [Candidatus Delongbacteria bacterium]|nr:DUF4097 domain-containing protein [Candidatus Delongbacteria bacterium]